MKTQSSVWKSLVLVLPGSLAAQIGGDGSDGVFHPKSNVVINTTGHPGGFDYKSITIPAGVTVALIGTNPAILRSQGAVEIAGTLHANGAAGAKPTRQAPGVGGVPGAGGYAGGMGGVNRGGRGKGPGGGAGGSAWLGKPQDGGKIGKHRTVYGSAWPFDLRGGSGAGGSANRRWGSGPGGGGNGGGGGGGTIVLLADGKVSVTGTVMAKGKGGGAGGSIMIRSLTDLRISGRIDSSTRFTWYPNIFGPPVHVQHDGFVRLDCYGKAPAITGTVLPKPKALWMPMLREANPLTIGQTWRIEAGAVPGDTVLFFASPKWAQIPLPPLGVLQIDPAAMFLLGAAKVPMQGHEPVAALSLPIPNNPALRGLWIFTQTLNPTTKVAAGAKLSNHIAVQVQ